MTVPKRALGIAAPILIVAASLALVLSEEQGMRVTAYFEQFKGIYVGDDVTVRGVPVGEVTAVRPERGRVKVDLRLDGDVEVPEDVRAVVIAQSLVSVRSVVLGPVGGDGPALRDGAVIPQSRTAIPVEWDEIKNQLVELADALAPTGANEEGAVSDLVSAGAEFLDGQGDSLNGTIRDMSDAMTTLADNSGDLFATVRNLQVFITALDSSDQQMRTFNQRLATVSRSLNSDRRALVAALKGLDRSFHEVDTFLKESGQVTTSTLGELRSTTSLLARDRQYIADLLQVAPTGVSNFYNILDPRGPDGTLMTGALAMNNLQAPAQIICGALLAMGGDRIACQEAIGPLAKYFALSAPPVGIGGLQPQKAAPNESPKGEAPEPSSPRPGQDLLGALLGGLL